MNNLSTNGPNLKGRDKLQAQLPSLCATLPIKPPQHVPHSLQRTLPCDFFIPLRKVSKRIKVPSPRLHGSSGGDFLQGTSHRWKRTRQRERSLITWLFPYDINTARIIIDGTTALNLVSVCIANLIRFNVFVLSIIILALLIFNHWILPTSSKGSLHNCSRQRLERRLSYLTPARLLLRRS